MNSIKRAFYSENYLSARKNDCFEGWYFRHNTAKSISFIVGVSKNRADKHSFVQVLTGNGSHYFRFPYDSFYFNAGGMRIEVAGNVFSLSGVKADLDDGEFSVRADIDYFDMQKYGKSLYAPSVMGPFSYLGMSCNHCVVSMLHRARGVVSVNGGEYGIDCGGYIEKDFGRSFPKNYFWMHATDGKTSVMFSYAWPLALGIRGFLCLINYEGKQYNFSLYSGARIESVIVTKRWSKVRIRKGGDFVELDSMSDGGFVLKAPSGGGVMSNEVREDLHAGFYGRMRLDGSEIPMDDFSRCAYEVHLGSDS